MVQINFIAVIISTFLGLMLGYLWYSVLFAKTWQKLAGVTDKQVNSNVLKRIIISLLLTFGMALNLAAFIGQDMDPMFGLFAGFAAGFGWVGLAFANNYLFEHRPFKLLLINGGYNIILLSLMGLIIGFF